ncbi:MAG: hypothetical protein ABJA64_01240, partial [Candidatus Saccharibacteria bacterium]
MQPTQNPMPIDYLNEISSEPKKPGMNTKLFLSIIIGAVLLIVVLMLFIVTAGPKTPASLQTLALRLQTTQKIAEDAQKNVKSSDLRSTNINLITYLTNTNRDIVEPLTKN